MINILKLVLAVVGFSLLIEASFGQGDAPAILRGLNQADKSIGAFIRTPNGQATKISSSSALIETGNNNILENPNFEHSVYDTSWVIGSGSSSKVDVNIDNTKVFSGLNALKMTMTASSLNVFNVSPTGNQAFKDGVQGLVSVRVKTTVSGIKVCQRKGFAVTTNCVNVNADGKWNLYKVPSILGEFYNGVEITSSPSVVTGDVYIDDAFVGAVDLQAINSFDTTCPTIGCETNFSAKVSAVGVVSGENLDWISGNCSNPATGTYNCTLNTGVFTQIANCTATPEGAVGSPNTSMLNITSATALSAFLRNTSNGAQSSIWNLVCQKQATDYAAAMAARIAYQATQVASYSAPCGADCVDGLNSKVSATDVVSDENTDWITGDCTNATAGVATCTFKTGIFTVTPNCSATMAANVSGVSQSASVFSASSTSVSVLTLSGGAASNQPFTLNCDKQGVDFQATRNIVGSFTGVVAVKNTITPTVCGVSAAPASISSQMGGCGASISTVAVGRYLLNFTSSFWKSNPYCVCSYNGSLGSTSDTPCRVGGISQTSMNFELTANGPGGGLIASPAMIICTGETL
jgi:hypothetical protein